MDLQPSHQNPPARSRWQRLLALLICELTILQPGLAAAAVSQVPMFTVTSVPPNVMLLFDDSASMNLMSLNPPSGFDNASLTFPLQIGGNPFIKMNTVGYYGISGVRFYAGGNTAYDNGWTQILNDVVKRGVAFNPLAYNPAVQYLPWNRDGTRLPNAAYGGNTNVAVGANTQWDARTLPANMGGASVMSKLVGTNTGWIPSGAAQTRALSSVPAGSVLYERMTIGGTPEPPAGADLFNGTITFRDPTCNRSPNYFWYCSAGGASAAAADVCGSGNVGGASASGTCCTATSNPFPFPDTRATYIDRNYGPSADPGPYPAGTPPAMTGPAAEVCTSIVHLGDTSGISLGTNCVQPPSFVAPCPGGGGELCTITPPQVCDTGTRNTWRCNYIENFINPGPTVCTNTIAQTCGSSNPCVSYNGAVPTGDAEYVPPGYWTPARYTVYDGPQPGTLAERQNLNNYRFVLVDRKFGWNAGSRSLIGTNLQDAVSKWFVVDGATGLPGYRPDCDVLAGQNGTWCTFDQEAQNYANWFLYYRNRLFAAVGVVSEVLSGFTGPEQNMRIGYGRINYFAGARNPWNSGSVTDLLNTGGLPDIEAGAVANEGAVERGVRPFTPLGSANRSDVFTWLFGINGLGPTPNREAVHAVGTYFKSTDSKGPWGANPGSGTEASDTHLWCRRNYTVLATDGEWTKLASVGAFKPQPLLERAADWTQGDPSTLGVTTSMSSTGTTINGSERLTGAPFTFDYVPANEPQITGGSGTQTGTLTDVMHYYWSHDLRPTSATNLRNSIDPTPNNRAFWQHMSTYVVGYGVNASVEESDPNLRTKFRARNSITWPTVGLEACRQLDDNLSDTALDPQRPAACGHTVSPSGNRINDTLRGALSSAGDFFSANSPGQLRASLDAVFSAINAENAAGTSPSFSNPTLAVGSLLVQSGFFTNTWEGYVQAFDAKAYLDFLGGVGVQPLPVWTANFLAPASRPIYTATAQAGATAVAFDWCNLSTAQRTALDPVYEGANTCPVAAPPIVPYLRGDGANERRNGGTLRDRRNTVLGDVVNSTPVYSKAQDQAYQLAPAASYTNAGTDGFTVYRTYVNDKQTNRLPIVMAGANDGMFHVFDARVGQASSGREIFGYVPRAVYSNLRLLSDPAYTHRYFVDGPIVEGDVWDGTSWKTIAIGTTGAGGGGIFAIDVTAPQSGMNAGNVVWDVTAADHPSGLVQNGLGRPIGAGVIGSVRYDADSNAATKPNGKWGFIVGNGYDSAGNTAVLFVFNAADGSLLKAIDTGVGNAGNPNGLGAVTPVYDGSRNIIYVYAGDKLGNLWKFDLTSSDPTNWKIFNEFPVNTPKPLFAATSGGQTRPIHQAPRITQHPLGGLYVAVGTGKYFDAGDPANTDDQGIFLIWDKGQTTPITFASVEQIRMQEYTSGADTFKRLVANDLANFDWNDNGFWIRLRKAPTPIGLPDNIASNGERVIAPLILDAGMLVVTTFSPENGTDPCIPGGSSYLYRLDLSGPFQRGAFGAEGAATVGYRVNPGTVGGLVPVYQPVDPGATVVESMTAADVTTMLASPKYRMGGGTQPQQQGGFGACVHAGLRVDGTVARIPTNCAGMMPLRSWRPMR